MNKLNELTGKEWIKRTKSWFVLRNKNRDKTVINHPAKFPEELAIKYIEFFTKQNDFVFDPFIGVGSTAVAAKSSQRNYSGIEINKEFYDITKSRVNIDNIILGDSRLIKNYKINNVDFILTSPPYWNILKKKRGNSKSQHKERENKNLKLYYSNDPNDLGNIEDYNDFLFELQKVFKNCYEILNNNKYMVVVIQNFRNNDGKYITLAWDIVKVIEDCGFSFEGEQIWCY